MESNATNSTDEKTESLDNSMRKLQVLRISDKSEFQKRKKNKDNESLTTTKLIDKLLTTVENLLLKHIKPVPVREKFKDSMSIIELKNRTTGKLKYQITCFNNDDSSEIYSQIHTYYQYSTNLEPINVYSHHQICGLSLMQKVRHRFKKQKWNGNGTIFELVSVPPNFNLEAVIDELAVQENFRLKAYIMFLYQLENKTQKD